MDAALSNVRLSLAERLKTYLQELSAVNRRWTDWMSQCEQAVLRDNIQHLDELTPQASSLFQDIEGMVATRNEILQDAKQSGLAARDLQSLADRLIAELGPGIRSALRTARQQLHHLRRLHAAVWVLVSECLQTHRGTMMLLVAGHTDDHVYVQSPNADTAGGQLLDTDL